ncbi:hypothetical protein ACNR9Q_03765 [Maribacter sp. X9]|uniref:hypothetical protein n=1 Tax=Maribacter sp. X9 TaxID=3402159 RepID=UPI003AF3D8C2
MNKFEELQNKWKNQPEVKTSERAFNALLIGIKAIERKQKATNIVLSVTIGVLVAFMFYVAAFNNTTFMVGITIMIVSLASRILVEISSIRRLKKLNYLENPGKFKKGLLKYYTSRKKVHYYITPIALIAYAIGFVILMPLFKKNLSYGFYMYILFSSVALLVFFSIFIFKQVKKELLKLRELQVS